MEKIGWGDVKYLLGMEQMAGILGRPKNLPGGCAEAEM